MLRRSFVCLRNDFFYTAEVLMETFFQQLILCVGVVAAAFASDSDLENPFLGNGSGACGADCCHRRGTLHPSLMDTRGQGETVASGDFPFRIRVPEFVSV